MIRVTVKLVLIFILVYAGVSFVYGRLEKRLLVPTAAVVSPPARSGPVEKTKQVLQKTSNYQIILTRNIFEAVLEQKNVEPKKKEPKKVVEKEPEKTTLKLVLQGTVSGAERDARAVIVDQKEKKQDIYQIGDAVQGALITSIERGKVILEVNGKKQLLVIKDRKGGGGQPSGRTTGSSTGPIFVSPKSSFTQPPKRSLFSKKNSRPPPRAIPHRRISFRQGAAGEDAESAGIAEPVEPLDEENMDGAMAAPGGLESGTEIRGR